MLIDIDTYRILSLAIDTTFIGFCLSMFLAFILKTFKPEFSKNYIHYAIVVVRILALAYLTFQIAYLISYFNTEEFTLYKERASGPYAWAYWYMLLRPAIYCSIIQFFWIKKIKNKNSYILILLFLLLPIFIFSGRVLELLIITTTAFHRDYLPSSWTLKSDDLGHLTLLTLLNVLEKTILYIILVTITWLVSIRLKRQTLPDKQ